ncbi:RNA-directed DNA polymerase, eukaryota, reverse transcriptase zinc-binding domain protein, partial [Tanacetum coccineum]
MEGLHIAFKDAVSSGLISGVMIGDYGVKLSHLFYANDVVIISDWNKQDMINIIRVLHLFFLASGLKINVSKSNIYGLGVSTNDIENLARDTGCGSGNIPFSYPGLPLGVNMNLISNWQPLIDRFRAKLSSWKACTLSIGGRLTLIKSVLGSLGIYYMSIFKCPESGGLNIGSLKSFNLALLQKWRWRLVNNPDSLWARVIIAIHGVEAGLDLKGCNCNGVWSSIISSYSLLHDRNFLPLGTLCRKVGNDANKDCLLSDRNVNGSWAWSWKRQVSLDDDGIFSVHVTRAHLDSCMLPSLTPCTRWWKILPRKVNVFVWCMTLDRLPTWLNLSLRGLEIPSILCPMCYNGAESVDHVFFGCELAFNIWHLIRVWTNINMPSFSSWFDWFQWFDDWRASKGDKDRV